MPGLNVFTYIYNSNIPEMKSATPRVDNAPHGMETSIALAAC